MKKLTFTLLLLTMISCNYIKNGISVELKNSTEKTIKNVSFFSDKNTKLEFDKIDPNQTVEKFLNMTNNQKGDGAYGLIFERDNGKKEQTIGGYYTNVGSLDKKVVCEIKNDTVVMTFSGTVY